MTQCEWCGAIAQCPTCEGAGRHRADASRACFACGGDGVQRRLIQRPIIRSIKGVKTVVRNGTYAAVCDEHAAMPEAPEPPSVRASYAARSKGWKNRQERLV